MKTSGLAMVVIIALFLIWATIMLVGLRSPLHNGRTHYPKDVVCLDKYKGAVVVGKQFDWGSKRNGAELISFRRGDSVWIESYMKSLWDAYDVGDSIK